MKNLILVFVGAGVGGLLRHGVNVYVPRVVGHVFPFGTLGINVVGSFLIGCVAGWLAFRAQAAWSQSLRLFAMTGILGGFTTFSAFSLETALLVERGEMGLAALYVAGSVVLALLGVFAGLGLMRALM